MGNSYGSNPVMAHVASVLISLLRTPSHGINLTAKNLGNVQSSTLVCRVPEKERLMVGICSFWGAGSGFCLGLGWECAFSKFFGKEADVGRIVWTPFCL